MSNAQTLLKHLRIFSTTTTKKVDGWPVAVCIEKCLHVFSVFTLHVLPVWKSNGTAMKGANTQVKQSPSDFIDTMAGQKRLACQCSCHERDTSPGTTSEKNKLLGREVGGRRWVEMVDTAAK